MKLRFTNTGEHRVKIMTKGRESGTPEIDHDNGIVEQFVEPGESVEIDFAGLIQGVELREYVPGAVVEGPIFFG